MWLIFKNFYGTPQSKTSASAIDLELDSSLASDLFDQSDLSRIHSHCVNESPYLGAIYL